MRLVTVFLTLITSLVAQQQDPDELLRLQRVLATASARISPSVVTVETFGGARRVLTADGGANDGIDKPSQQLRLSRKALRELFEDLDDADLDRLFPDRSPEQRGELKPQDLQKLRPDQLLELLAGFTKRHGRAPGAKPSNPNRKEIGPLVQPGFLQAQGPTTGVVLSADGWILISRFALNFNPTTILVTLVDGRSFNATRHGEDTSRGIALIKIEASGLPVPEFVDPADVRVGQWAFVLGRTFGAKAPSVHMGIVSANYRLFRRAVQIDAWTSPANYGGSVIDVRGRVIGIAVPLSPSGRDAGVDWYDSGIGFATTIFDIPDLIERMQQGEALHRAWLGITAMSDFDGPGSKIASVVDSSPAQGAGLEVGDTLLEVNGVVVRNPFHLQVLVNSKMAGEQVLLRYQRADHEAVDLRVLLAETPRRERESKSKREEMFVPPWEEGEGTDKPHK